MSVLGPPSVSLEPQLASRRLRSLLQMASHRLAGAVRRSCGGHAGQDLKTELPHYLEARLTASVCRIFSAADSIRPTTSAGRQTIGWWIELPSTTVAPIRFD